MLDNRLEIIVEIPNIPPTDPTSNVYGITIYYLDTYSADQSPMELNFVVNDIKDLSNRNASSSKTLTLPETPNNREVFGFVSDLNTNTLLFSPNKRTKCYVLVDTVEVFQGWLQLKNVKPNYRTGLNKLEVVIYSNQLDFFKAVGESYLQDLQGFKTTSFTHSISTMTASWFQNQTQTDIYYPLIDYGFTYDINNVSQAVEKATGFTGSVAASNGLSYSYVYVDANQMYPSVYLKSIVDAIFYSASGSNYEDNGVTQSITYQYDSYFFNSPFFRNLIIPYANGTFTYKSNTIFEGLSIQPTGQTLTMNTITAYPATFSVIQIGNFIPYYNPSYNYQQYRYIGKDSVLLFEFDFTGDVTWYDGAAYTLYLFSIYVEVSDSTGTMIEQIHKSFPINGSGTPNHINSNFTLQVPVNNDNIIGVYYYRELGGYTPIYLKNANLHLTVGFGTGAKTDILIQLGESIDLHTILPSNVKQKDFLNTLFNMFNLYIDYDPNVPNILRIEPRDDYYYYNSPSASSSPFYLKMNDYASTYFNANDLVIKDWSDKVDINEDVNIEILANTQNKTINLTYKQDKDYYNDNYMGFVNRVYGNKLIEVDNDFNVGQKNIEVLFGPTVLANIFNTYNFPIANLTKQIDTNSYVPSGRANANMKIMQRYWDYISPTSSHIYDKAPLPLIYSLDKFVLTNYTATTSTTNAIYSAYTFSYYPYAGNFNNPYYPAADLNFDQAFYYYYNIGGVNSGLSFSNEVGLNNTIYNTFYQNQMNEILDNTSRIVTCKMYLTPKDIQQFRFSDLIYLRLGSSGQYYHVNKISNYSLTAPQKTVDVELIKVLNVANYPIP